MKSMEPSFRNCKPFNYWRNSTQFFEVHYRCIVQCSMRHLYVWDWATFILSDKTYDWGQLWLFWACPLVTQLQTLVTDTCLKYWSPLHNLSFFLHLLSMHGHAVNVYSFFSFQSPKLLACWFCVYWFLCPLNPSTKKRKWLSILSFVLLEVKEQKYLLWSTLPYSCPGWKPNWC